jgi:hypothetical protein
MRPHWLIVGAITLSPALFGGCTQTVPQSPPQGAAPESHHTSAVADPAPLRLEPAKLDADELADFLGVSVWTFHYSGGRVRCWVEIEQNGKTTTFPPQGAQDPNRGNDKAKEGKILLWLRPGTLKLSINSGVSHGNFIEALPQDGLWWAWKASTGLIQGESGPFTPKTGVEITLLRYQVTERGPGSEVLKSPRTITIVLKAQFPEER